jgi:MFS family permease
MRINSSQTSFVNAGMVVGATVFFPLSHKLGRSSATFWSLVGLLGCQIWSALMTNKTQYAAFMGSRFMSGFFGTVTGVIGPRVLVDLFFLHQRGRAFTIFHWWFDLGTVAGPTLSAFIASTGSWTYAFWWTAGLSGLALITSFFFLHETAWDREPGAINPDIPQSFVANRIATFFPGTRVTPHASWSETVSFFILLVM